MTTAQKSKIGRPRIYPEPRHAYIVKDGKRFRLCVNVRTPKGPRRKNLATLGTDVECATITGALAYWQKFLAEAQKRCKAEFETHPDTYKRRRTWQRAAAKSDRAHRHLEAISPYIKHHAPTRKRDRPGVEPFRRGQPLKVIAE
jgi:hypothetical protein